MLSKLIEEGKKVEKYNVKYSIGDSFQGQEYEIWKAKALILIDKNYRNTEVGRNFILTSKTNNMKSYNEMMGILIALQSDEISHKDLEAELAEFDAERK